MTALNSYTDELKSLWTDTERKTEPYAEEPEQVYTWFGLDTRMEIGTLNKRFREFLDAMKNLCVSRTLSNWIEETLNDNPFVPVQTYLLDFGGARGRISDAAGGHHRHMTTSGFCQAAGQLGL